MAKLYKEKFYHTGKAVKNKTTATGQVELYLYFNSRNHCFYFDSGEIEKVLNLKIAYDFFSGCKTRDEAVARVEHLIDSDKKKTKMLSLEILLPKEIFKFNVLNEEERKVGGEDRYDNEITEKGVFRSSYEKICMGINFERFIKMESGNGVIRYQHVDENWEVEKRDTRYSEHEQYTTDGKYIKGTLIEWSPEIEAFLLQVQEGIREMSRKVVKFFDVKDAKQLEERIKTNVKLLN
jgi:hypothetical protein